MSDAPKRFDGWEKVDCNDCGHYWLNQCDGVKKDGEKPCNSFLATRKTSIPEEIKSLKEDLLATKIGYGICIIALAIGLMIVRFGWF